ncbi:hypothetical protein QA802_39605 [Streptomyces sp. B21-105]|uniref:hypothetical protein n=1 Tax=Streptomyces sp. B21-105 TaxID=3039417 RepID=UPI002FF32564
MKMFEASRQVKSLSWVGDDLVDTVGGGIRWTPDGTEHRPEVPRTFAADFDRAVHSPSGRYSVVYQERGTQALLLDGGRPLRELDRSDYQADASDYPVALAVLGSGREVLVHCPDEYNVLQVEDTASGERLTTGPRDPKDVFHSRLSVSPDGRHVLMAGWVWQPYGVVEVYDLEEALSRASALDGPGLLPMNPGIDAEIASACWLDADRLAVATTADETLDDEETPALGTRQMGVWSLSGRRWLHRHQGDTAYGTLIPCGNRVVSLHGHPRLIDVADGTPVAQWPEVRVSRREGAYGVSHTPTPVAAPHPDGSLLAVAHDRGIAVLACGPAGRPLPGERDGGRDLDEVQVPAPENRDGVTTG